MPANAARYANSYAGRDKMEGIDVPLNAGSGIWAAIIFAILGIGTGITTFVSWWRRNKVDGANAGAHINSISEIQAILAAEREDHRREAAELRAENAALRERADKFAAERNDWMMKFSEVVGELRAVKTELEGVRSQLQELKDWRANNANP